MQSKKKERKKNTLSVLFFPLIRTVFFPGSTTGLGLLKIRIYFTLLKKEMHPLQSIIQHQPFFEIIGLVSFSV